MTRSSRALIIALLASLPSAAACAGTHQCAETAQCAIGTVCQIDGTCRALDTDLSTRFARSTTLMAREVVPLASRSDDDTIVFGGGDGSGVLLSFADLPEHAVVGAELVFEPHHEWLGADEEATIIVARVRAFDAVNRRVELIRDHIGEQRVPVGVARPLRFDLTEAVRDAQRAGVRHFDIAVRIESGSTHALAYARSPRPRLELLVP